MRIFPMKLKKNEFIRLCVVIDQNKNSKKKKKQKTKKKTSWRAGNCEDVAVAEWTVWCSEKENSQISFAEFNEQVKKKYKMKTKK